jgi:hypothetical protein
LEHVIGPRPNAVPLCQIDQKRQAEANTSFLTHLFVGAATQLVCLDSLVALPCRTSEKGTKRCRKAVLESVEMRYFNDDGDRPVQAAPHRLASP